jgi:hypothetical protein
VTTVKKLPIIEYHDGAGHHLESYLIAVDLELARQRFEVTIEFASIFCGQTRSSVLYFFGYRIGVNDRRCVPEMVGSLPVLEANNGFCQSLENFDAVELNLIGDVESVDEEVFTSRSSVIDAS